MVRNTENCSSCYWQFLCIYLTFTNAHRQTNFSSDLVIKCAGGSSSDGSWYKISLSKGWVHEKLDWWIPGCQSGMTQCRKLHMHSGRTQGHCGHLLRWWGFLVNTMVMGVKDAVLSSNLLLAQHSETKQC